MSILVTGYEGDTRMTEVIDPLIRLALADRGSIRNSGAVVNLGAINGSLSRTHQVNFADLDGSVGFAATAAEDTALTATDPTITSVDITAARFGLMRSVSDFYVLTGQAGRRIDAMRLAQSMAGEYDRGWMNTLATTIAGASTTVGSTGVDMSVTDFFSAQFALELARAYGPIWTMLEQQQYVDFQTDILGLTSGVVERAPATAEQLAAFGSNYKGQYFGANIFVSDTVTASGGDNYGAMWAGPAIGYKYGVPENPPDGTVVMRPDQEVLVAFSRTETQALTHVIGHAYMGMAILEQGRIVGIVTDE